MTLAVMALYARAPRLAQHCQLARQGNRPHCGHGHRAAQARRHRGGRADFIRITPPASRAGRPPIHTYDDHRVAMCFSLASLQPGGLPVRIEDPNAWPRPSRTTSKPCSRSRRWRPNSAFQCCGWPHRSGQGTVGEVAQAPGLPLSRFWAMYRITALAARQGLGSTSP